jgi:hypothetical protein
MEGGYLDEDLVSGIRGGVVTHNLNHPDNYFAANIP